jgi:hypothetical protein
MVRGQNDGPSRPHEKRLARYRDAEAMKEAEKKEKQRQPRNKGNGKTAALEGRHSGVLKISCAL